MGLLGEGGHTCKLLETVLVLRRLMKKELEHIANFTRSSARMFLTISFLPYYRRGKTEYIVGCLKLENYCKSGVGGGVLQ